MKKFLTLAIGLWIFALGCISAQTLEQKKICALKWTLQQTFYNKAEGQQMAHIDVTEFKSFDEFKKNELVSKLIKRVSDATDKRRIDNIINAKTSDEIKVPNGASKEYQGDIEKIKSVAPAQEENAENQDSAEEQTPEVVEVDVDKPTEAAVTPVEKEEEEVTESALLQEEEEETENKSGMGIWGVILTSVIVYIVLTICLLLFRRSRQNTIATNDEDTISQEQYRSDRLRLMERIKGLEIELDNLKRAGVKQGNNAQKPAQPQQSVQKPAQPQQPQQTTQKPQQPQPAIQKPQPSVEKPISIVAEPKKEEPKHTEQSLFDDKPDATVTPIIQPTETPSSIKPSRTQAIMFFPVPVNGVFANGTDEIEIGKSLYMLRTSDGQNATFTILNTPEAIKTALISLSEMVKPVCKIINTVPNPLEIVTEGPGTAVREGDTWKMVTKSVVRLL